jgi:hypothetical protein
MHLLCTHGDSWNEWYALSASADAQALQAEAERRNREDYERQHAEWLARGKSGPLPLHLDDPRREGYRQFFVREVPDWPLVGDGL